MSKRNKAVRIDNTTEKENSSNEHLSNTHATHPSRYGESRKKCFHLLTVILYLLSVSLAAIMLAIYYTFLWQPRLRSIPGSPGFRKTAHSVEGKMNSSIFKVYNIAGYLGYSDSENNNDIHIHD